MDTDGPCSSRAGSRSATGRSRSSTRRTRSPPSWSHPATPVPCSLAGRSLPSMRGPCSDLRSTTACAGLRSDTRFTRACRRRPTTAPATTAPPIWVSGRTSSPCSPSLPSGRMLPPPRRAQGGSRIAPLCPPGPSFEGRSAWTTACREIGRPVVHQPPPALKQVRPGVGRLDLVLDHVRQRRLDDLARVIGLLGRPVPGNPCATAATERPGRSGVLNAPSGSGSGKLKRNFS